MKLLGSFRAEDVESGVPQFDYASFRPRKAVRAIVFDEGKVALLRVGKHGYYMLPGGGVEGPDVFAELAREIAEELGCGLVVTGEVGCAEVYFDRWSKKQTDYCYTAQKGGLETRARPTDFEKEEGHEVIWADSLSEAIVLVEAANPPNRDGKLVRARDLLFLKSAQAH